MLGMWELCVKHSEDVDCGPPRQWHHESWPWQSLYPRVEMTLFYTVSNAMCSAGNVLIAFMTVQKVKPSQ